MTNDQMNIRIAAMRAAGAIDADIDAMLRAETARLRAESAALVKRTLTEAHGAEAQAAGNLVRGAMLLLDLQPATQHDQADQVRAMSRGPRCSPTSSPRSTRCSSAARSMPRCTTARSRR